MATGDLIYEILNDKIELSPSQAATFADSAIGLGAWDGDRADMIKLIIERDPGSSTGFSLRVFGKKSVTPGSIPVGVQVIGKEA